MTQKDFIKIMIFNIETSMNNAGRDMNTFLSKSNGNMFWMRYCLPYQAVKLKNGQMLFRNRGYQPVFLFSEGSSTTLHPDYKYANPEDFVDLAFDSELDEKYFYGDGTKPWESKKNLLAYLENLKPYLV